MEKSSQNKLNAEIDLSDQKLGGVEKVSYGLGNLAANLLITTANSFIVFFYTEIAGIAVATVGTLLMIARVFDGITDLGMGMVVDKTKSKHGKARPWLLWMSVPYVLALILLFTSPEFGETGKVMYAFITYVLAVGITFTMISVPYNSMLATLSQDQNQRGQLSIFRTAFGFAGAMLIGVITLPIVNFFGGGKTGWVLMATVYGIVGALLYLIVFRNTKERVAVSAQEQKDTTPIKDGLKALLNNKYWLLTITIILLAFINSGLGGINVFYAQYILGDQNLMGILSIATFLPIILAMFVMNPLLKKFGKRNLAIIGGFLSIIGSLLIPLDPESTVIVFTGLFIRGLGGAPLVVAGFAMLADTVEYGEWKTGVRTEGLTLSAGTFGEKVGSGVGGMVLGVLMGIGGYIGGQAEQSVAALNSIQFVFIYLPIIISILSIVLLYFYKLDKEYPTIIKELHERNAK